MKTSRFNLVIPATGEYLINNTLSGAQIMVDEKALNIIQGLPDLCGVSGDDVCLLEEIKGLGIVVDDEVDEGLELEYWFQRIKFDTALLNITLLTTYACNLACTYCYEEGVGSKASLDRDIAKGVIEWIKNRSDMVRPRELRINFFGGEPLMNKRAIKDISRELKAYTGEKGIDLSLWIITNGVLLEKTLVGELVPMGLKRIKVTLDGNRGEHDAKRRFKNGMGTFDIIMDNLKEIKGLVPISIGGNYDDQTKGSIPSLLDMIVESGLKDHIADIRFKPIFANPGDSSCNPCSFSETDPEDMIWIRDEAASRGFNASDDIAIGPCDAVRENSFTIDPLGRIYKCPGFVGREDFVIGDINKDLLSHKNTQFMTTD
ncbi:MAG: radical SAM protein, partial [Nitrospirota bacterium]